MQNHRESDDATLGLELQQTQLDDNNFTENKLVGVVSDNPFASDAHSSAHGDGLDVDSEAAGSRESTDIDAVLHQPSHPVAKESTSLGADYNAFPDSVDPLDTSLSGGSNINHDHSRLGTDIPVGPQSCIEQSESSQHVNSNETVEQSPRIAFATSDHIDSAQKSSLQGERRASARRGTMLDGYDFSGKLVMSRNNSVVSTAKRKILSSSKR